MHLKVPSDLQRLKCYMPKLFWKVRYFKSPWPAEISFQCVCRAASARLLQGFWRISQGLGCSSRLKQSFLMMHSGFLDMPLTSITKGVCKPKKLVWKALFKYHITDLTYFSHPDVPHKVKASLIMSWPDSYKRGARLPRHAEELALGNVEFQNRDILACKPC